MGVEQTITFPEGETPSWPAARDLLASRGFPVQVRMIDGELSFPDEEPPENWHELRIGTPKGMMTTVRRERERVVLVAWGSADPELLETWNALTWAFAETANGQIGLEDGWLNPSEYASCVDLPATLRG